MLCSRWSGRAGIQLVGEWSTRHGLLDHRGVAAQVEFEGKVLKQFSIFYFQALKPWALSTQVLILSTCTVLPPPPLPPPPPPWPLVPGVAPLPHTDCS